ncbi:Tim10/DDP family zinc finger protein [Aspergillus ambiguus]|uniref:protein transporter TIM9 n=1 Tax=Aspergillus ambiguus TaxID=176160 RepID=UPI003CCCC4F1
MRLIPDISRPEDTPEEIRITNARRLNASEQREFAARMERKQLKEFMTMYSKLVQRCFDDCVNDFTTKSLISREEGCVMRCVDKYLKGSARLNERFQEQNAAMMQSGQMPGR